MGTEQRVFQAAAEFRGCPANELVGWQIYSPTFRRWTFWRVESDAMPAFPVCVAALADNVRVIVFDNGFSSLTEIEPIDVASVDEAVEYIRFFVQVAKPDSDVLESLDDISGVPEQEARAYQGVVTPPSCERTGEGYRVQENQYYEFYAGNGPAPLADLDLRIKKDGLDKGLLVLNLAAQARLAEDALALDRFGIEPRLDVNAEIPPEGTVALAYSLDSVEVRFRFRADSRTLRLISIEWGLNR